MTDNHIYYAICLRAGSRGGGGGGGGSGGRGGFSVLPCFTVYVYLIITISTGAIASLLQN